MRRMTFAWCAVSALFGGLLLSSMAVAQDVNDKQAVLDQARQSYYNLRAHGLATVQCEIKPNWELLLENEKKQDKQAFDLALKTLSQLRFNAALAADDSVKVTHNELTGQNAKMAEALSQIYGGMEQMTSGFFDTWKLFMLNPPFPDIKSQYRLESVGQQFRLTYKEGAADVVTTMDHNYAISNLQVTTPEFNSVILPTFTRTPNGWRLSAYQAAYKSQKPEESTQLKVSVDYQDVDGLSMVQKLNLSGSYGGSPFAIELAFSGCQVTRTRSSAHR